MTVLESIRKLLNSRGAQFREIEHEPTFTSREAARVRGVHLEIGGKALLIKTDSVYRLFVLSAALQVNSRAIRSFLRARRTRFATPEELSKLTGLVPGSVPPFGHPILPFDLYVDESIAENQQIAFNAGSLTHSMLMTIDDYLRAANPTIFHFSREP